VLADIIRDEILERGPIPFDRFMELALYHPRFGYYRRARDPFGKDGDFFTAGQLQPVYGRLIASVIRKIYIELGEPDGFMVVELGAGRGEMKDALRDFNYLPIEVDRCTMPERFTGVVFANEFFDALPVRLTRNHRELRVGAQDSRFVFTEGPSIEGPLRDYVERFGDGEIHLRSQEWIARVASCLDRGYLIVVDYGTLRAERARFPEGTLMSYRRHVASEDVLSQPGERDITSHVPFDVLQEACTGSGMHVVRLETLQAFLLRAGEHDSFAEAIAGGHELKLKTLLFGMGESFRVLTVRR
jgi:SAM-dependent MidA family methyltransferase